MTTDTTPAPPSPAPHVWELRPLSPAGVRCVLCGERAARSHQRTPCEPDGWPDTLADTLTDLGGPSCPDDDGDAADDDDLIRELAAGWEPGGSGKGGV